VPRDAYCGTARRGSFGVDLVTGSVMTTEPEVMTDTVLELRGLSSPPMHLYPVVDHVADKLCATQATYGTAGDRPSSRVRDLVDLVVFARSQDIAVTHSSARSAPSGSTVASTVTRRSRLRRTGIGSTHPSQGRSARARA